MTRWWQDFRCPTTCFPCLRGLFHVLENLVLNWARLQQLLSTYLTWQQAEAARLGSTTSHWHVQRRHLDGQVYSPNGITLLLLLSKVRGSSLPQTEVMYCYSSWNVHVYVHYTGTWCVRICRYRVWVHVLSQYLCSATIYSCICIVFNCCVYKRPRHPSEVHVWAGISLRGRTGIWWNYGPCWDTWEDSASICTRCVPWFTLICGWQRPEAYFYFSSGI